jgi:E3 ubiquitin-protein ligase NEDD4
VFDGSQVRQSSMITIQVFDHKKFKKRDQGFLGVYNMSAAEALQLAGSQQGDYAMIVSRPVSHY